MKKEPINKEIDAYFKGQRKSFSLAELPEGTAFQKKVWAATCDIPYGETISYSELAKRIGRPKAFRAVAQALNRNPWPVVIPCHRVIGKSGDLVGFGGGLPAKEALLNLEKLVLENEGR